MHRRGENSKLFLLLKFCSRRKDADLLEETLANGQLHTYGMEYEQEDALQLMDIASMAAVRLALAVGCDVVPRMSCPRSCGTL